MFVPALVCVLLQAPPAPTFEELEVAAPGERYVAELRPAPGQERVRPALARWRLTVWDEAGAGERREVWSCAYPYTGQARHFLLSADGHCFVHVDAFHQEGRPIVRIHRDGQEVARLAGADFDVETGAIERGEHRRDWLRDAPDALRIRWADTTVGPVHVLELDVIDGRLRAVELGSGLLVDVGPRAGLEPERVEPAPTDVAREASQVPYVREVEVAPRTRAGRPVEVHVSGDHPTPGWWLAGWDLRREEDEVGSLLVLTPRATPPAPGGIAAQVIAPFQSTPRLIGLEPGSYRVIVEGRQEPTVEARRAVAFEVVPGGEWMRLRTSGGFAGISEERVLFGQGVLRVSSDRAPGPELRHVGEEALLRAAALAPGLPRGGSRRSGSGADYLTYELGWWDEDKWRTLVVDDGTSSGATRDLIELLRGL